jgi:hypothetical protein
VSGSTDGSRDGSNAGTPRRIAHLDLDAFFASIHLVEHPELRGFLVSVGDGRSMSSTSGNSLLSRATLRCPRQRLI